MTSEYENIYCNDKIEMSSCSVIDSESLLQITVVTHFLSDILSIMVGGFRPWRWNILMIHVDNLTM